MTYEELDQVHGRAWDDVDVSLSRSAVARKLSLDVEWEADILFAALIVSNSDATVFTCVPLLSGPLALESGYYATASLRHSTCSNPINLTMIW